MSLTLWTGVRSDDAHAHLRMVAKRAGLSVAATKNNDNETDCQVAEEGDPCIYFPSLQTDGGVIFGFNAILRHIARLDKSGTKLYGSTAVEQSLVDGWLDFAASEIDSANLPYLMEAFCGVPAPKDAMASVEEALTGLELWLETRTFLVGERLTIADIAIAFALQWVYRLNVNHGEEMAKKYKNAYRLYNTVMQQEKTVEVLKSDGAALEPSQVEKEERRQAPASLELLHEVLQRSHVFRNPHYRPQQTPPMVETRTSAAAPTPIDSAPEQSIMNDKAKPFIPAAAAVAVAVAVAADHTTLRPDAPPYSPSAAPEEEETWCALYASDTAAAVARQRLLSAKAAPFVPYTQSPRPSSASPRASAPPFVPATSERKGAEDDGQGAATPSPSGSRQSLHWGAQPFVPPTGTTETGDHHHHHQTPTLRPTAPPYTPPPTTSRTDEGEGNGEDGETQLYGAMDDGGEPWQMSCWDAAMYEEEAVGPKPLNSYAPPYVPLIYLAAEAAAY